MRRYIPTAFVMLCVLLAVIALSGCVSRQTGNGKEVWGIGYIRDGQYQNENTMFMDGTVSDAIRRP